MVFFPYSHSLISKFAFFNITKKQEDWVLFSVQRFTLFLFTYVIYRIYFYIVRGHRRYQTSLAKVMESILNRSVQL